ncbi:NADPH-dependent 7-cyano-7-deazaguanine reductase QueF [Thalassotalea sp. PS06]|uniref:NADPH-dependent 7-cyano-7-deazaguanine reductase QueF n=1 Tax=Thalassotalea sp. PS06 TaxID=2594005 RepID=UPI0011656428|nr:NADPH-dependent 7-cyano-7-deazaguanine reductase QueF [Thalassotalea sp. PS06]QDP01708.1 NADPH-dependent 7-cyano-7-deazaguanine reductase QueF [Thalassotalea sp. PS06]
MSNYQNADELKALLLGKETEYKSDYDASLLQGVPRSLNRDSLAIDQVNLPFLGEDVWYGFELSWLNAKGLPQVAVAEFRFPCTSTNIVESKSFKLYLNSFNQTRFSSWDMVKEKLGQDLSLVCDGQAIVNLFDVEHCPALQIASQQSYQRIDDQDIEITNYQFDRELLEGAANKDEIVSEQLVSHLLKSNCLITNQPDWASLYIDYRGGKIDQQKLLRYLISFRQHNEFHEQCVERIFVDLMEFCQCQELTVYARYTRRGGLDINPYRSTNASPAPDLRTIRQ